MPSFRRWIIPVAVVAAAGFATFWWLTQPTIITTAELPNHTGDVVNGEVLFHAGGCASCHAAPGAKGDTKKILSGGLALKTPFGTFLAPNISADPTAGIGSWSITDFINAMVRGVSPDGRHYYPAFPYTSYQRMSLVDLIDLRAYMATLPADATPSKIHQLSFPFTVRRGLGLWKFLYLDGAKFQPNPGASVQVNRGAYLVEGPGHCGECHTPRSALGGLDRQNWLAGGPAPEGDGKIPNITPHKDGLAKWSLSDIAYALESGFTPDFDAFGGAMVSVQENIAQLPKSDREAIAAYLKAIPAISTKK